MLSWMRKTMGGSAPGASSSLGALEEIFAPAAAKARLDLESRHEMTIPIPSPGDKLLTERLLVIKATKQHQPEIPGNRTNSPD
ncbi:MAG: hypothetical protein Q7K25_02675 [Actinomycetota bacterium]|nr:hypothetical protein [Actinomycetota bacterium]